MALMNKRKLVIAITTGCAILLICYELFIGDLLFSSIEEKIRLLIDMTVTRSLGAAVFTVILVYLGYKVLNPIKVPFFKALVFCLPAYAVAVNNFPFSSVIRGNATIKTSAGEIVLLAAECLAVALFEEMAFRGVIFLSFAEKRRNSRLGLFISIILSSAVFAIVHLLNIFTSSPSAVIMQIGYSFLIGGMCSVVLIKTANIWHCVAIHAIFNFSGAVVPTLGAGEIWDSLTIMITAIIAVITFVYMLVFFLRFDVRETERIYKK